MTDEQDDLSDLCDLCKKSSGTLVYHATLDSWYCVQCIAKIKEQISGRSSDEDDEDTRK
jgi:hypothetical protein